MLNKIAFIYTESENQNDLFTPYHTRFDCAIKYGTHSEPFKFNFQCNTAHDFPTIASVMYSLIVDGESYQFSYGFEDFMACNGYYDYEKSKEIYDECKRICEGLHKMFTDDEIQAIMDEIDND